MEATVFRWKGNARAVSLALLWDCLGGRLSRAAVPALRGDSEGRPSEFVMGSHSLAGAFRS